MKKNIFLILTVLFTKINLYSQTMFSVDPGLEHLNNVTLNLDEPNNCNSGSDHKDGLTLPKDGERIRNHSYGDNWARTLRFKAKFDNACAYTFPNNNPNQLDWNKLMNIAEFPHTDFTSIRLGWRWSVQRNVMEVGLYGHIRNVNDEWYNVNAYVGREFLYLTDVALDTFFDCELILSGMGMGVIVNGVGSFIKREDIFSEGALNTVYFRSAYFGGQECPPNDMEIRVERIKGDNISNWDDGACEKTFSRSIFYNYDNFTINAARTITLSEQVYRGQYVSGNTIPTGYSIGDEIPWFQSDGGRFVTIKDGADITFKAGDKITLKTGFHAEAGSKFNASINSSLACASFVARYANSNDSLNAMDTLIISKNLSSTNINVVKGDASNPVNITELAESKSAFNSINIYPNPANNSITISLPTNSFCNLIITDILGKMLIETVCNEKTNIIDISSLSNGVYMVKAKTNDGQLIKKLIKE